MKKEERMVFKNIFKYSLLLILCSCSSWIKPTPTQVASPIYRINLEDLMITIEDLPSTITWESSGIMNVVDENAELKGKDAVKVLFWPNPVDFAGLDQLVLRFSSNTLAEEYYNKPVATDVNGYAPPVWKFESSLADQARITCDNNFGTNIDGPLTCFWIARYGQLVVKYQVFLSSNLFTIETMQKTVERIDEKITQALRNIE